MEITRKLIPQKIMNLPFYHNIFWKKTIFAVETIEEKFNEMDLDMVQKKGENFHLMNMTKI